jgi:hypothetical protein
MCSDGVFLHCAPTCWLLSEFHSLDVALCDVVQECRMRIMQRWAAAEQDSAGMSLAHKILQACRMRIMQPRAAAGQDSVKKVQ